MKRGLKYLIVILCLLSLIGLAAVPGTSAFFSDTETSSGNVFLAWVSTHWLQTTKAHFDDGVLTYVDTSSSPGDVKLAVKSGWYNTSWQYRRAITLSAATSVSNYQVLVTLTTAIMGNPYAHVKSDGSDIRFTGPDGITLQDYWIESWSNTGTSEIWVEVANSGTSTIYLYYGNSGATSASNGTATFEFFDDFSGGLGKWTIIAGGWAIDAGRLTTTSGTGRAAIYGTGTSFGDAIIEFKSTAPSTEADHNIGSYHRGDGTVNDTTTWLRIYWDTQANDWKLKDGLTVYTNATGDSLEGVWRNQKIVMVGTTQKLYVDGILKIDYTGASGTNPGKVGVFSYAAAYLAGKYWDDYRVRKYAATEPTTSVGSEEGVYVLSGTIASQVLDTLVVGARWDGLFWDETLDTGTSITFEVRASDTSFAKDTPHATLPWIPVGGTSPVTSGLPSGRYMQWQATLTTPDSSITPTLHEVSVYYY